ncbi:DUF4173 domain-containing protein [Fulvivirga sp. M361]|uniref:DUF4153 domain-containing protein n=1 Tax=Fulvivirga sp. M361 TaxID=2594266 RepID=UPI00117BC01C|nr:DUF4173 domain-containing protein [Fulvivirga sp. M361]TRX56131.1 DUF4173 domain-containing protein [Fulvivirga sp. M361]
MSNIKRRDLLLLLTIIIYSYLFYEHDIGINLPIFNLTLLAAIFIDRSFNTVSKPILVLASTSLITSIAVIMIHSDLAITASVLSTLVLLGYSLNSKTSMFVTLLNAVYSIMASPFIYLARYFHQKPAKETHPERRVSSHELKLLRFGSFALPALITLIFLSLYANANPAFSSFIKSIDLDFISWGWVRFTMIGSFLLFGCFYGVRLNHLIKMDIDAGNRIERKRRNRKLIFHPLALKFELKTGMILLFFLNILLLVFNIVDIRYVLGATLPEGLSYSEYVHQGVYTLIVSIILAILIILYFLRSNLNFYPDKSRMLLFAYVWIIQNIVLALTTAYKNALYIEEYSLTYKRIGVFVYLFLALAGLLTTYLKVVNKKNLWYLIRRNSWVAYGLLCTMSIWNWDKIITQVNYKQNKEVDFEYLIKLSDANLPLLQSWENNGLLTRDSYRNLLQTKRKDFYERMEKQGWQSWNYRDDQTFQELEVATQ